MLKAMVGGEGQETDQQTLQMKGHILRPRKERRRTEGHPGKGVSDRDLIAG